MSKIIKSEWASTTREQQKIISIKMIHQQKSENETSNQTVDSQLNDMLVKEEAEMIIKEASLHAQSIKEQITLEKEAWENKKIEIAEQAKRDGYSQGYAEGKEQGYKEYHETILSAQEVVNTSKLDYQHHVSSAEKTILELGMKVAERILGEKIKENEEVFLSIVKRALKEARDYREIQLHIHPKHYKFVLSQKDELVSIFPKETDIYIYPDDELTEKACIIESGNGRIDASVDSQLMEIKRKLFELLESESE